MRLGEFIAQPPGLLRTRPRYEMDATNKPLRYLQHANIRPVDGIDAIPSPPSPSFAAYTPLLAPVILKQAVSSPLF